ncbi:MAG TPA: chaperone NapD [Lysobacter sp.]
MNPTVPDEVHIASFVVQHRAEASAVLAAHIDGVDDLELALSGGFRSVVLCECADQYAILDRIEALRALPGVLNVALVYHHAEPSEALDAPVSPVSEFGVVP